MIRKAAVFMMIVMMTAIIPGCGSEPAKEVKPEAAVKKEEPAKAPAATAKSSAPMSCYEIGFRTGRCAAKSMSGLPCDHGDEIPIPPECQGKPETEKGKKDGLQSVY